MDLLIEVDNEPGALAAVAAAISDAGVNIAAATCTGAHEKAELHVLVPHAGAARHAARHLQPGDHRRARGRRGGGRGPPGELADIARRVAKAGVNIDLLYIATGTRVVLGSPDLDGLKRVLATETVR